MNGLTSKRQCRRVCMYSCSKCKDDTLKADEFSCYQCYTCIDCGGCDCVPQYEPEPEMKENEEGFMDYDYGQQFKTY
jgi:hypothetical protein